MSYFVSQHEKKLARGEQPNQLRIKAHDQSSAFPRRHTEGVGLRTRLDEHVNRLDQSERTAQSFTKLSDPWCDRRIDSVRVRDQGHLALNKCRLAIASRLQQALLERCVYIDRGPQRCLGRTADLAHVECQGNRRYLPVRTQT